MAYNTMYPPRVNSPITTLSAEFEYFDETMYLTDSTVLPDAPNYAVVSDGDVFGTFRYTGKSGNDLTGVTYIEGSTGNWASGSIVGRFFTAKDLTDVQNNLDFLKSHANLDDLTTGDPHTQYQLKSPSGIAANDFLVGNAGGTAFEKKSLADTKAALGTGGLRSFWLDFFHGAYQPSTNGSPAAVFQYELSTSKIYVNAFQFATDVDQNIQALWLSPANATGKVKVQFFWTGATSNDVVWGYKTRTMANDAALDGAWNTGITVTDGGLGSLDCHLTAETTLTAIEGFAAGQPVWFQFYRNGANAADTHTGNAYLIGVKITYEINHLDG